MTITQNVDPQLYNRLTVSNIDMINKYIESPMTATIFIMINFWKKQRDCNVRVNILLDDSIKHTYGMPKWHLNRLLTLIRVCNIKNSPPKKMSKKELVSRYASLNATRRKQLNTKG